MTRPAKFRNTKTVLDGITFDSKKEANRYAALKQIERAGLISNLELQPVYQIEINGVKVCKIIPDFRYQDKERGLIVEDVKSPVTARHPVYRLKKKLLKAVYGIDIQEV